MPQIKRQDGENFVVYTYREILTRKTKSLLKKELNLLAKENGEFARLFLYPDGDYELILANEPGYLLAELVWSYFNQTENLIFCEKINDKEALLVVIRDGNVCLDALINIEQLGNEFLTLSGGETPYNIYIVGKDLPISELPSPETVSLPAEEIASFNILNDSVFNNLPLDESLKLLPLDAALAELPKEQLNNVKIILLTLAVCIIGISIWEIVKPKAITTPLYRAVTLTQTPPYANYNEKLSSPAPNAILIYCIKMLKYSLSIPGWLPDQMHLKKDTVVFSLKSFGGDTGLLLTWLKKHNADLQVKDGHAYLAYPLAVPNRNTPNTIYNIRDTVSLLYDGLKRSFPVGAVSIQSIKKHQHYVSVDLQISFSGISFNTLHLLAKELTNFPLVLKSFEINEINQGILSGELEVEVLGAAQ